MFPYTIFPGNCISESDPSRHKMPKLPKSGMMSNKRGSGLYSTALSRGDSQDFSYTQ